MKDEICHCGKPLHYTNSRIKAKVDAIIEEKGSHVDIVCRDKRYSVPRHYIALHGIKAADLDKLGFDIKENQ
jgi:hypothetical protein